MARFGLFAAALCMIAITAVSSASIVFEDSKLQSRSNDYSTDSRALRQNETPSRQSLEEEDARLHHNHNNHNKRKNKRIICGIAHLINKREADVGLRRRRETTEQGRGLGVAGFLLGAYVGSKYQQHQYQYPNQPHPPQQQQQQGQGQQQQQGIHNEDYDQVEDQGGGGGGNHGGGGSICNSLQQQSAQQYIGGIGSGSHFPILASLLTNGGGGGGGNKIGQLPQSPGSDQLSQFQRPGPVQFSQFQRPSPVNEPQFQRPAPVNEPQFQRPAPVNEPQFQRPAPVQIRPQPVPQRPAVQQQQQNGFVNTYVRPWVDLFFR